MISEKYTDSILFRYSPILLVFIFALQLAGLDAQVVLASPGITDSKRAEAMFRFPAGGVISTGPVASKNLVWLMADSKTLYVLDINGRAIGRRDMPTRKAAFIVPDGFGRAAVIEGISRLSLINKAGQTVWSFDTESPLDLAPCFGADGRIFLVVGSTLSCRAANGRLLWSQSLDAYCGTAPRIGPQGGPLLAFADGSVRAWNPDGRLLWSVASGISSPSALCWGSDVFLVVPDSGAPRLGKPGGELVRIALGDDFRVQAVLCYEDGFLLAGAGGVLVYLDGAGTVRWQIRTGCLGRQDLAVFPGRILVLSAGLVASFNASGQLLRQLSLQNSSGIPAVGLNGAVFSGGTDWILYAYRFERDLEIPSHVNPAIDIEAALEAAREEAFWTPGGGSDDALTNRLFYIENSLKSGNIKEEAGAALLFAAAVASGRLDAPFGEGPVSLDPVPRTVVPRVAACELLGLFGNPAAIPILAGVFSQDMDPVVRAAAADALASIGLDPNNLAMEAFELASRGFLETRVALAMIAAVEALYRAQGGLEHSSGALALVRLLNTDYPREVRQRAETALKRIRSVR